MPALIDDTLGLEVVPLSSDMHLGSSGYRLNLLPIPSRYHRLPETEERWVDVCYPRTSVRQAIRLASAWLQENAAAVDHVGYLYDPDGAVVARLFRAMYGVVGTKREPQYRYDLCRNEQELKGILATDAAHIVYGEIIGPDGVVRLDV